MTKEGSPIPDEEIPFEKRKKMSPRMESFISEFLRPDSEIVGVNNSITKHVNKFLTTDSAQVQYISGLNIIQWMSDNGLINKKGKIDELKEYANKQSSGRGLRRRTTSSRYI